MRARDNARDPSRDLTTISDMEDIMDTNADKIIFLVGTVLLTLYVVLGEVLVPGAPGIF